MREYRVESHLDPKGRVRRFAVYTGEYFSFTHPRGEVERCIRLCAVCATLIALSLLAPLLVKNRYIEQFYTMVPLLAAAFPLCYVFSALWRAHGAPSAVSRRSRDRIDRRICVAALWLLILSAAQLPGSVIYLIFFEAAAVDWVFAALAPIRLLPALLLFARRSTFSMAQTDAAPPEGEIIEF